MEARKLLSDMLRESHLGELICMLGEEANKKLLVDLESKAPESLVMHSFSERDVIKLSEEDIARWEAGEEIPIDKRKTSMSGEPYLLLGGGDMLPVDLLASARFFVPDVYGASVDDFRQMVMEQVDAIEAEIAACSFNKDHLYYSTLILEADLRFNQLQCEARIYIATSGKAEQ